MRNSSHSPGCMRRMLFPSGCSHCCQFRGLAYTSAAACACVSPAASRAARTSAGEGLRAGWSARRFGWLGMELVNVQVKSIRQFAIRRVAFALHQRNTPAVAVLENRLARSGFDSRNKSVGVDFEDIKLATGAAFNAAEKVGKVIVTSVTGVGVDGCVFIMALVLAMRLPLAAISKVLVISISWPLFREAPVWLCAVLP